MLAQAPQRKYRIERYLAEGGMGAIYVGKKLGVGGFEKEVVLKQLLPEFTERPEFRDLFFREAKISASLDHVNIVRTSDLVASDDSLFIVMEYVRGADLRTINWRARMKRKHLSTRAVLHVALEILAGLAYAHGRKGKSGLPLGIIHRDVSPSNILCSGQGDVKLSDFGIAKATTFSSVFYRVRGKVGYMSPEQARNETLDMRSDLFSLAVCIFESLTGERLYAGDMQTPAEQLYGAPLPSLSQKRPDLPPELEAIMARALASDPDARYPDASALGEALREVARRHGMLYSAPLLAIELRELLGPDPATWSHDETVGGETERMPAARTLEGREATSLKEAEEPLGAEELPGEDTVSLRPANPGEPVDLSDAAGLAVAGGAAGGLAGLGGAGLGPGAYGQQAYGQAHGQPGFGGASGYGQPGYGAPRTVTPGAPGLAGAPVLPPDRTATPIVGPAAPPRRSLRRRVIFIAYLVVVGVGIAAGALWTIR